MIERIPAGLSEVVLRRITARQRAGAIAQWAAAMLLSCVAAAAQGGSGPVPPCGTDPRPGYPEIGNSPVVKVWTAPDLGTNWAPPACLGWTAADSATVVVTVGRFRNPGGADSLRRRLAAVSGWKGVRYWSTTGKRWQTLIVDAYALAGADGGRRADFSPEELAAGKTVFFNQEDNLSGKAAYRLRMRTVTADRLVFETENVSPMRYLVMTLFEPGGAQAVYFLERETGEVWRYYAVARTRGSGTAFLTGHDASLINRAAALFRHLAGIPTDQEPPVAR